jgi:hypothetical protein
MQALFRLHGRGASMNGWCMGAETFRHEWLAQMSERMGEERTQTVQAMAE